MNKIRLFVEAKKIMNVPTYSTLKEEISLVENQKY